MRWLVALVGAAALLLASWWVLRLRWSRTELRVALNLRPGDPDDMALSAGVNLALDERDFRAGRYRLKTAHQTVQPNGRLSIPNPGAHTMLYGLRPVQILRAEGSETPLFRLDAVRECRLLLAWARTQGRKRVVVVLRRFPPDLEPDFLPLPPREPLAVALEQEGPGAGLEATTLNIDPDAGLLRSEEDLVFVTTHVQYSPDFLPRLRRGGFEGPIFLAAALLTGIPHPLLARGEGGRVFLAAMAPLPPDFLRRHAHPLAYLGYLGTRRYLDDLDAEPTADPYKVAQKRQRATLSEELLAEPRIFVIRNGRLVPEAP